MFDQYVGRRYRRDTRPDPEAYLIKDKFPNSESVTIQIRADENIPYHVIKKLMRTLARLQMTKIELSALKDQPDPLPEER